MNKKILIGVIVIIIAVAGIGAYLFLGQETIPDFEVNGTEVKVNDTYDIDIKDSKMVISLAGANFTIPEGFEGNLSYQSNSPKADFKNEENYLTITFIGEGTAKELANQFIENNNGFTLGNESKKNNITIVEINQGANVVSHMYYVQIGDNVYDINLFGIKIQDIL